MKTKSILSLAGAALAATLMVGCADYGPHRDVVAVGVDYDGYYDDYYGPFADGYWGPDGAFYFTDAPGHAFRRDDAGHFRHDSAAGFHTIHGHHNGPGHP